MESGQQAAPAGRSAFDPARRSRQWIKKKDARDRAPAGSASSENRMQPYLYCRARNWLSTGTLKYYRRFSLLRFSRGHKTAKFQRFNRGKTRGECDAVEFPDGRIVTVSELVSGQTATVVRVPPSAQPESPP
jgi:hypothetical protein